MKKVLLIGEGGQGVQAIAEIMAKTADSQELFTTYIPQFGVEQRGGVSLAFLQIDSEPIAYPRFDKADIIVAMCNRAIEAAENFLSDNSLFIYDSSFIEKDKLAVLQDKVRQFIKLPAKEIGLQKYSLKSVNMIFLGGLAANLEEIDSNKIIDQIKLQFAKHPEFQEGNIAAFNEGLGLGKEKSTGVLEGIAKSQPERIFQDSEKSWERFPEYCKGCGLCLAVCPKHALTFDKELNFLGTNLPKVDLNKCAACEACQKICPEGAIKVTKKTSN